MTGPDVPLQRLHAERASAQASPVTSPRQGLTSAQSPSMPMHLGGPRGKAWHPRDAQAAQERRASAAGSLEGPLALSPGEIPLSDVQIGRDTVGPDGKASPVVSECAASAASSRTEGEPRGRQLRSSRHLQSSRAAEESQASLGSATSPPTPFGAGAHQLPGLAPPIVGRQLQKAESMGESASVASSELPEQLPRRQNGWAPDRPPPLKLKHSSTQDGHTADLDKLNDFSGKAGSRAAAGGAGDQAASGDANAESLMDAVGGPSDIPAGDDAPTAGGEATMGGLNMGEQPAGGMMTALRSGAANVARDAPEALAGTGSSRPQTGEARPARDTSWQGGHGEAQHGGLPPRGAMHGKFALPALPSGPGRPGGDSPRIANISECAPLEYPLDSLMSTEGAAFPGPGRAHRDDEAEWPPPMTNAGRRRLSRPILVCSLSLYLHWILCHSKASRVPLGILFVAMMGCTSWLARPYEPSMLVQGGEGQAPPKSRWQNRPHQKFVHLVFLSARPESFKGLTVRRSSCVICSHTLPPCVCSHTLP